MNLTFVAKAPSKTANISIYGIINGQPLPFPGNKPDACELNCHCPINQNDVNSVLSSLDVLEIYPPISRYVQIVLIANDLHANYSCVLFPATT